MPKCTHRVKCTTKAVSILQRLDDTQIVESDHAYRRGVGRGFLFRLQFYAGKTRIGKAKFEYRLDGKLILHEN